MVVVGLSIAVFLFALLRSSSSAASSAQQSEKKEVFWALVALTAKSWADVNDKDDDDNYATTAPPQSVWDVPVAAAESEAAIEGEAAAEVKKSFDL